MHWSQAQALSRSLEPQVEAVLLLAAHPAAVIQNSQLGGHGAQVQSHLVVVRQAWVPKGVQQEGGGTLAAEAPPLPARLPALGLGTQLPLPGGHGASQGSIWGC